MAAYITPVHPPSGIRSALCLNFFSLDEHTLVVAKSNRLEFYSYNVSTGTSVPSRHDHADGNSGPHRLDHPNSQPLTLRQTRAVYGRITSISKLSSPQHAKLAVTGSSAFSYPAATIQTDRLLVTTDRHVVMVLYFSPRSGAIEVQQLFSDLADRSAQESQYGHRAIIDPAGRFVHLSMFEGISTIFHISQPSSGRLAAHGGAAGTGLVGSSKNKATPVPTGALVGPLHCRIRHIDVKASAFLYPAAFASGPRSPNSQPKMAVLYKENSTMAVRILRLAYLPGSDSRDDNGSIELLETEEDFLGKSSPRTKSAQADLAANHILPLSVAPYGFLVLSQTSITWFDSHDLTNKIQLPLSTATIFITWVQLNDITYALADEYCNIYLLHLDVSAVVGPKTTRGGVEGTSISWSIFKVGETSRAEVLVPMPDPDYIFVGSHQGDSMLVKVSESGPLQVIQTLPGLAPILDLAVFDLGKGVGTLKERYHSLSTHFSSGQAGLVVGSGSWKDGRLSLIRRGVYWKEKTVLPQLPLATRLFPLNKLQQAGRHHDVLAVSLPDSTLLVNFNHDSNALESITVSGLDLTTPTILARGLSSGHVLQVTGNRVVVCDLQNPRTRLAVWEPDQKGTKISLAKATSRHLLLVFGGSQLAILSLDPAQYLQPIVIHNSPQQDQISSIDIRRNLIFVGYWLSQSVFPATFDEEGRLEFGPEIALLPILRELEPEWKHERGGADPGWYPMSAVPRDICLARYTPSQSVLTALVSLDFGAVVMFDFTVESGTKGETWIQAMAPRNRRIMKFGSLSARFEIHVRADGRERSDTGGDSVLVLTEFMGLLVGDDGGWTDPAVSADTSKVVYSVVDNTDGVVCACFFSPPGFANSVAMVTGKGVVIGEIGEGRATLVSPLKMHETIRRLGYSAEDRVFALGTISRTVIQREENLMCRIALVDEGMGGELDSYSLRPGELVESVVWADLPAVGKLGEGSGSAESARTSHTGPNSRRTRYCLVGTTCIQPSVGRVGSSGSTLGRLLILEVSEERKWRNVSTVLIQGGCRCIAVAGDFVIAGLTKTIVLFGIERSTEVGGRPELKKLSSYRSSSTTIDIVTNRHNARQVAVLDLMKSVHILEIVPINEVSNMTMQRPYLPEEGETHTFRLVAAHPATVVGTAMGQLDEKIWVTADSEGRLRLMEMVSTEDGREGGKKGQQSANAGRTGRAGTGKGSHAELEMKGGMMLGEMVNCIRPIERPGRAGEGGMAGQGNLLRLEPDSPVSPRLLAATVDGSVYMIGLISPEKVGMLTWLQCVLAELMYQPFRIGVEGTAGQQNPRSGPNAGAPAHVTEGATRTPAVGSTTVDPDGDETMADVLKLAMAETDRNEERPTELLPVQELRRSRREIEQLSDRLRTRFLIGAGTMADFFRFRALAPSCFQDSACTCGADNEEGGAGLVVDVEPPVRRDMAWPKPKPKPGALLGGATGSASGSELLSSQAAGAAGSGPRPVVAPETPVRNFVDGDLVERFLDLGEEMQAVVVKFMNVGVWMQERDGGGCRHGAAYRMETAVLDGPESGLVERGGWKGAFTVQEVSAVVERLARLR